MRTNRPGAALFCLLLTRRRYGAQSRPRLMDNRPWAGSDLRGMRLDRVASTRSPWWQDIPRLLSTTGRNYEAIPTVELAPAVGSPCSANRCLSANGRRLLSNSRRLRGGLKQNICKFHLPGCSAATETREFPQATISPLRCILTKPILRANAPRHSQIKEDELFCLVQRRDIWLLKHWELQLNTEHP
jgi:hypothetical protein